MLVVLDLGQKPAEDSLGVGPADRLKTGKVAQVQRFGGAAGGGLSF